MHAIQLINNSQLPWSCEITFLTNNGPAMTYLRQIIVFKFLISDMFAALQYTVLNNTFLLWGLHPSCLLTHLLLEGVWRYCTVF